MIENVLAGRYASPEMREVWDPRNRVHLERGLWLSVLEGQRGLGMDITQEVIDDYRKVVDIVDLDSIDTRELVTRHDVKARLDEFNHLAGHEVIHLGMTSRDLTENVELHQVRRSLELVEVRVVAALVAMARLAVEHNGLAVTGRSHNVPAQVTTVGKRIATAGEEMLAALTRIEDLVSRLPFRGIKGPVGTQQDQTELLGADGARELDRRVAEDHGFGVTANSIGQVYPRSVDFDVVAALTQLAAGPSNLTTTLRLMAGHDLVTEGFVEGQVGSSAMPHKMNTRTSERIHGLKVVLTGHLAMAAGLAGEQWAEGDVSCSVVRRVMLPDAFFAFDGLLQAFLTVLDEVVFFPAVIEAELQRNLPFLATTRLLVAAVGAGMGRETAHALIRDHSVAAAMAHRLSPASEIGLLGRLGEDERFPLDAEALREAVADPMSLTGRASEQVETFVASVGTVVARHPSAADYRPAPIL